MLSDYPLQRQVVSADGFPAGSDKCLVAKQFSVAGFARMRFAHFVLAHVETQEIKTLVPIVLP